MRVSPQATSCIAGVVAVILILGLGAGWIAERLSQPPAPRPGVSAGQQERHGAPPRSGAAERHYGVPSDAPVVRQTYRPAYENAVEEDEAAHERQEKATSEYLIAVGTIALAVVTFFLVVVTGVLARYTYRLWKDARDTGRSQVELMNRQASIMTGQLEAAATTAKATENTVAHMQDQTRRELRAYIGHLREGGALFENVSRIVHTAQHGAVQIVEAIGPVKYFGQNYGRTPAYDARMYVRVVKGRVPDERELDQELGDEYRQQVVGIVHPGQNIGRMIETDQAPVNITHTFFLWGAIHYTDIFGDRWRYRFAFDHSPARRDEGREAWIAHHSHNDEQHWKEDEGWVMVGLVQGSAS